MAFQQAQLYPIPSYRYTVNIVGNDAQSAFSEVSGLELGYELITYKDGKGVVYMPGQPSPVKITMKRGTVTKDDLFYKWISTISLNQVTKHDVTISLTDETGATLYVTWTVKNAFPLKLAAPGFNATSNEIAIESLDLQADTITIDYHK